MVYAPLNNSTAAHDKEEEEEEDSALERHLEEGQNNTANWLEKGLEKYSKQRRRRRGSPDFAIKFRAL